MQHFCIVLSNEDLEELSRSMKEENVNKLTTESTAKFESYLIRNLKALRTFNTRRSSHNASFVSSHVL